MEPRKLFSWLLILVFSAPALRAAPDTAKEKAPPAKSASSLDDELLKGLGDDPLKGLSKPDKTPAKPAEPQKPADQPAAKKPDAKKPSSDSLDDELLKGLGGEPERKATGGAVTDDSDDPIAKLTRQMREVERLIREKKSDEPTQKMQEQIVRDLETLLKEAQKRAQKGGGSSQPKPQQTASRDKVEQADQQQGKSGSQSNEPARDSSESLRKTTPPKPDMAKLSDVIKDIWGELPPRLREQMMQASAEKFLPKYELLIEEYFKTLAEQQQKNGEK
jgi:hypothetical protein